MTWGTPIPSNAAPQPIQREDGSLDWTPLTQAPTYDPNAILGDASHNLHAAWLAERDARIAAWDKSKETLEAAKNSEIEARKAVQSFSFGPSAKEGMNNQALNNGWTLKFGKKMNTKIVASNDKIEEAEDKAGKVGNEGSFLFERCIKVSYDFSKSEYNKLDVSNPTHKAVKALIDDLIETTEGTGSLELKAPKATLNG